jgi:uncharacterized protein YfaS (alpha-2-macroglobulin family)
MFRMVKLLFVVCALTCSVCSCEKKKVANASVKGADDAFCVLNFTPEGELPAAVKSPSIQVQFSEPVVPLTKLGKPSDKSDIVKIEPELKGTFRWYGTSLLSFECSEPVIPQKEYKVTVSERTTSVAGNKITGTLAYSFHTEELKLVSIVPGYSEVKKGNYVNTDEVPVEIARDIAVYFNTNVNPKVIAKELTVTSDSTDKYDFSVTAESESVVCLKLKKAPSADSPITVTLPKGSMTDEACYATSDDQTQSFHTLRPLTVKECDTEPSYLDTSLTNPVQFVMNHFMKQDSEAEIAKHVSTEPKMKVTAANIYLNGTSFVVHSLPVTFNSTYEIKVDKDLTDAYGLKLGSDYTKSVTVPEANSFVYFKDYGFNMLESQYTPRLAFEFQNILPQNSHYYIRQLTKANGVAVNGDKIIVDYAKETLPQNKKVVEVVDATKVLEKTAQGYRGAFEFAGSIGYKYKYKDWDTDKFVVKDQYMENKQVIQVTDLGMTVRYGYNRAAVLVTSLSTGKPVANAKVSAYGIPWNSETTNAQRLMTNYGNISSTETDAHGFAVLEFAPHALQTLNNSKKNLYIEAKTDSDRAIFQPDINSMWRTNVESVDEPHDAEDEKMVVFIFTDRGLYKPGETLTFRGIDRTLSAGTYTAYDGKYTISFTDGAWKPKVYDIQTGSTTENGTFWGKWKVPENLEPGTYEIEYSRSVDGETTKDSISFQVQFFERLRFEANASVPSLTYYSGDKLNAEISAQYLGGGSLAGCTYNSYWSREPSGFSPKGTRYDDMNFGPLQGYDGRTSLDEGQGALSGDGKATVSQTTGGEKLKGMAYTYRMEAQVTDTGNQMISTVASVRVHPAKFYLGVSRIKGVTGFPVKGDTLKFDYACVTPDGTAPLATDIPSGKNKQLKIELLREDWKEVQQIGWNGQINTRYEREMVSELEKSVSLDAGEKGAEISVVPPKGGAYILRLSTHDARGNEVITETRFYVMSKDWTWFDRDDAQEITMTADKELYTVGETAHILMQSPLPKGTYMMTVEREGILSQEVREINEPTTVIDVKVESNFVPVMYVTLSSYSVRTGKPSTDFNKPDLDKPKGYFGLAAIHVDPTLMKFDIDIKTDKPSYKPGESAKILLHASKDGAPLSKAEITLMAVDRGVIDLINYHVADPVAYFYAEYHFPNCVKGGDSRSLLIDPVTYEVRNLFGGDSANKEESKIEERKNFEPTALFVPDLVTDENGDVSYTFTLPDSLTAYRITAVGVQKNNFSIGENEMPVANPVSVRDVLPRKLRLDDKGETGVTISNLDSVEHQVTVKLALYDGIEKTGTAQSEEDVQKLPGTASVVGPDEQTIMVQPNTTLPLMFNVHADKDGWITVEYTVTCDVVNEKILKPLEIEKPYIYETVTTVGEVRSDEKSDEAQVEEKIVIPTDAVDGKGNIYVQLDATRLGALHDAVNYVFMYPYGCMEQRSSFVLPLVAFGDYIKVFGLESEVKKPFAVAKREIKTWGKVQHANGGFPYWPDGSRENLDVSIRIGEILALCEEKGISTKDSVDREKLAEYIQSTIQSRDKEYKTNSWENYEYAYAQYVIQRLGVTVSDSDIKEVAEGKGADISSLAFCGLTYVEKGELGKAKDIAKKIRRYTKYSTRGIDITSMQKEFEYWSFFNDKSEDYALVLQLFSKLSPEDDINQYLMYELLEFERAGNGYWKSTAVTARVLSAIDVYIRANDLKDTNFTAEALLNGKKFVEGKFKGLGAEPVDKTVDFNEEPVVSQKRGAELPLTFTKKGTGSLFYTASMKYAVPAKDQYARDEGICLYTEITDVKTGEVVDKDKLVAGTVYRERVFVTSTRDREYVAVRAPIPAGCEVMNATFVTTGTIPQQKAEDTQKPDGEVDVYSDDGWIYSSYRFEDANYGLSHQAIYDSEVQYFWDIFPKGNQQVEFLFRAARKGTYNTPSGTAECMYQPEVFGRSAGAVWTIE